MSNGVDEMAFTLSAIDLSDTDGNLRTLLVRNFDGTNAPKGDKHIARFMRARNLKVVHLVIFPGDDFAHAFDYMTTYNTIFRKVR